MRLLAAPSGTVTAKEKVRRTVIETERNPVAPLAETEAVSARMRSLAVRVSLMAEGDTETDLRRLKEADGGGERDRSAGRVGGGGGQGGDEGGRRGCVRG